MDFKHVAILITGLFIAASFAGCVGSDENDTVDGGIVLLAKAGDGEWTNETVVALVSEEITADNRDAPASRTKTVQAISFMLEGASEGASVVWDFGDLTTETTGSEATHTYAGPGAYFVTATIGEAKLNTTVAVNYHATGGDSVFTYPGTEVYQEGVSYYMYLFSVGTGAKKCEIDLKGTGAAEGAHDIDMHLFDPSGKEIATSTGGTSEEHISCKAKTPGNYQLQIGQGAGGAYASVGNVDYTFTIDVLYA